MSIIRNHGLSHTRLYKIWSRMKQSCYNPNYKGYRKCGRYGINMCDEWKNNFLMFYQWAINNGYHEDLSIVRKCNKNDFKPENCKWDIPERGGVSKQVAYYLEIDEVTKTLSEWAEYFNFPVAHVYYNYIHESARTKEELCKKIECQVDTDIEGRRYSLLELSLMSGISISILEQRVKAGMFETGILNTKGIIPKTRIFKVKGELLSLSQIAMKYGINKGTLEGRARRYFDGNVLIAPINKRNQPLKINIRGKLYTLKELAKYSGVSYNTIRTRYYRERKRGEELISTPYFQ
ncbi:hypothetical protein [Halalkalibacter alkaliphilus]|uniref:Uncharacterized protein n=1 Tax=Halalkalibacter alkaliphilus TaxID=2917993 RepID=A0A9X2I2P2_9BACI|nr:hypothetical protein [Halalkalibacter alkaliphilus]MCL7747036.1 hypothetical protein [Halalkalibacter alkaliphilus]